MTCKTVLVQADPSPQVDQCIDIAARIAIAEDAHLTGAAMVGVSRFVFQAQHAQYDAVLAPHLQALRDKADRALDHFEARVRSHGVQSYERRLVNDDAAGGLTVQARYCDLLVLPQYDAQAQPSVNDAELPAYVAMNSGCPVLLVPPAGSFESVGRRVLVAWNASVEATRAIRGALPLLQRADNVDVVVFDPEALPDSFGAEPGADLALYLARHGIRVNVIRRKTQGEQDDALLLLVTEQDADLVVMGCYGHSRFREILLGGMTRSVLQRAPVPVLMAH